VIKNPENLGMVRKISFQTKFVFSDPMKCLRIRALIMKLEIHKAEMETQRSTKGKNRGAKNTSQKVRKRKLEKEKKMRAGGKYRISIEVEE
jgi:hypothetical protein